MRSISARIAAVAGAGLITAGLAVPAYAEDPAVPNVSGFVTNAAGVGLVGMSVEAYKLDPNTGYYDDWVDSATTTAGGAYTIEDLPAGSYKFYAGGYTPDGVSDLNTIPYISEYNGDARNERVAPVVAVAANVTGFNFALSQYGLITGTNTGNGAPLYRSYASAFGVDGGISESAYSPTQKLDPATGDCIDGDPNVAGVQCVDQGGQAYRLFVEPGTYKVQLGGYNFTPSQPGPPAIPSKYTSFVDKFFGGKYSLADAKTVTVGAGQTVAASEALDVNLANLVKARIVGSPTPGKTLKANPGRWTSGYEFTRFGYSWTVNGVVVSTTSTYTVKKADLKKKIVLTITAAYGDNTGVAQLSTKVGLKNKLKAKSQAVGNGKVKFTLSLKGKKLAGKFKGKAEVWYLPIESKDEFSFTLNGLKSVTPKRVGKAKVSANGTATITTKKVDEGKGLFMVVYKGSKKAAANESPWKSVKVK